MTTVAIHQPCYIPWLGYFYKMMHCDVFVFLDNVQFSIGSHFGSRNKVWTSRGEMWLTVPCLKKRKTSQRICDVKIDKTSNWRRKHKNALRLNYSKARCFNDYSDFLDIYNAEWQKLKDLNKAVIGYIAEKLDIHCEFYDASLLGAEGSSTDLLVDICKRVHGDAYLSGFGGRNYQEPEKFEDAGIELKYSDFVHPVYPQLGTNFVSHLSIVDLLFNCGSQSRSILLKAHGECK